MVNFSALIAWARSQQNQRKRSQMRRSSQEDGITVLTVMRTAVPLPVSG